MDFNEITKAAQTFDRISAITSYVSKERFMTTAKCVFNITDEKKIDIMFGLLNKFPKISYLIANKPDSEMIALLPQAIEIADKAFEIRQECDYEILTLGNDYYYNKDKRRYFYKNSNTDKEIHSIDVNLKSRFDIITFAELLKNENVQIMGVTHNIGELDTKERDERNNSIKREYFEGDIYFLFNDPTDRLFYDWFSYGKDAGVYIATDEGWKRLLYTPGRGYLDKNEEPDIDTEHTYSDYMLDASGKGTRYIGNIHADASVLSEKKK